MSSENVLLTDEALKLLVKCEGLKAVERHTKVLKGQRCENSAEHSWHASLACLLLREYEPEGIDHLKVLSMLVVHELVEVNAGDYKFFEDNYDEKAAAELQAANDLFPADSTVPVQAVRSIWFEFEFSDSAEAKYAQAIDMFMPTLVNCVDDGKAWGEYRTSRSAFLAKKSAIRDGSEKLWELFVSLVDFSVTKGWIDSK